MDRYRTFWKRWWAGVIDGFVFVPLVALDPVLSTPDRSAVVIISWNFIGYFAGIAYSVILHAKYGKTLGKMATGVQVLNLRESRIPTLRQAFMRDIGYVVLNVFAYSYVIYLVASGSYSKDREFEGVVGNLVALTSLSWFAIELVTMLTNSKRRALHDLIAGTVVVQNQPHDPREYGQEPRRRTEPEPTACLQCGTLIQSNEIVCPSCGWTYTAKR